MTLRLYTLRKPYLFQLTMILMYNDEYSRVGTNTERSRVRLLNKESNMPEMKFRETFFRPIELNQEKWTLAAAPYNSTRRLLKHAKDKSVFVPIRTMQFLAIIDKNEIVFIDGASGYKYQDNEGGRIIQLAWQNFRPQGRESLSAPVPCQIVYYLESAKQTMKRIVREFSDALVQMEQRSAQTSVSTKTARILTIRAGD